MSRRRGTFASHPNPSFVELYEQLTIDDILESLRAKGLQYRGKRILSGNMLELEIYPINPVWKDKEGAKRIKTTNPTRKEQRNLNHINTRKRVSRLIHSNFTHKDIWVTFTYADEQMPTDIPEATKHLKNYFKRLRRHIKKNDLPDLKYIYVTERVENEATGKVHTHHHIVMNFRDRDAAESLWTLGGRTQARRLQPDKDGSLEGLARYIAKQETKDGNRKGAKTYAYSKNLTPPDISKTDGRLPKTPYKLSKKRVTEMATNENKAIEVLEEQYSGYKLIGRPVVKFSDYTAGAFIYARMVKKPGRVQRRKRRRPLWKITP